MTQPTTVRYEFTYTDIATNTPKGFALAAEVANGISEAVAMGVRYGLQHVASITDVYAAEIQETQDTVALPPSAGGPLAFDSASPVQFATAGSGTWNHGITDVSPGLLVLAAFYPSSSDPPVTSYTMTCGAAVMGSLGAVTEPANGFWAEAFSLTGVAPGEQTIGWDFPNQPNMTVRCQSLVYANCGGFGGPVSATGNDKNPGVTVASAADHMAAAILAWDGTPVSGYSAPTQTERGFYTAGTMPAVETQDAPGAVSVPFGALLVSKVAWCVLGVNVTPAP